VSAVPEEVLKELAGIMEGVGEAVKAGDVQALAHLVPAEEAALRRVEEIVPGSADPAARDRLAGLLRGIAAQNTQNAILIQGQVALIHATMKALFPEGKSFDQLA